MELAGFRLAGFNRERIAGFLDRPAPRILPAGMWKRLVNPLALVVLLVTAIFNALVATAMLRGYPLQWMEGVLYLLPLFWVLYSLLHTRTILARGRLSKGLVTGIQKIKMKEGNYRRLFLVQVKLGADGPGRGRTVYEVVDNHSVEYFEKAWVLGEAVSVLHAPGAWPGALLPGKINAGALFK